MVEVNELHRPASQWPLLLAGPMLRRVTEHSIAVFVAMRERCTVELDVYAELEQPTLVETTVRHDRVVSLGARLHVCVVEVGPAEGTFQPGHEYFYDLHLVDPTGGEHWLYSLPAYFGGPTLLFGPVPLGYVEGRLPSFMVPVDREHLRIVQASCRKPHGCNLANGTDPDALPMVDRLFGDHRLITDANERLRLRPDQLILTGDQIYADDVAASLLAAVTSIGHDLLAWGSRETFPDRRGQETFGDDHPRLAPGKRSEFLDDQKIKVRPPYADNGNRTEEQLEELEALEDDEPLEGGNSSDYSANHLLFFAEWCAMYLLNWSQPLWAPRAAEERVANPNLPTYTLPRPTEYWEHSPDTTTPALIFAEELPFVRRAMANVPTYMIFDDHDVTDDWFLNRAVNNLMRRGEDQFPSSGGRRLMRNALAAYAIFQHWGNVPEQYGNGTVGGRLLDLFDLTMAGGGSTPLIGQSGHEDDANTILDIGPDPLGIDRIDERILWHYALNFPSHRLLVLDTRTWREFPDSVDETGAQELLDAAEQRADDLGEWGLMHLRQLRDVWVEASQNIVAEGAVRLGELLSAGAGLIGSIADVAEAIRTNVDPTEQQLVTIIEGTFDTFDALDATDAVSDQTWAVTALNKARAEIDRWAIDPDAEAVEDAIALALAIDAAVLAIRTEIPRSAATFAIDAATDGAARASAALFAVASWLDGAAGVIKGAAVSTAEAARQASTMVTNWMTVSGAVALALTNPAAAAAAIAAQATAASAPIKAALDAAAYVHSTYLDPVWNLLLGKGANALNAGLISEGALQVQVDDVLAQDGEDPPFTVVVSPAPLFGNWIVELYQKAGLAAGYSKEEGQFSLSDARAEEFENEPWSGNLRAYYRALASLASLRSIVVLSGDVHYGFSSVNDYVGRDGRGARFIQLTSSSAKNSWFASRFLAAIDADREDLLNPRRIGLEFWQSLPTADAAVELVPSREDLGWIRDRLKQEAVQEWTELGESFEEVWDIDWGWANLKSAREALARKRWEATDRVKLRAAQFMEWWSTARFDFLYGLPLMTQQTIMLLRELGVDSAQFDQVETTVLHDRRTDARAFESPDLDGRLRDWEVFRSYLLHSERRTVGRANIGVISFGNAPGGETVVHDFYSFPFDTLPWILGNNVPPPATEFRGDWIITRHVAGRLSGSPADMGIDP